MSLCRTQRQVVRPAQQSVVDDWIAREQPGMHKAFDERLGVVEIGIFQSRPVHPKRTTTRSRQSYIVVIANLKRTATHAPSAGQSRGVAAVSGPRRVRKFFPPSRVTTISKLFAATERKVSARSLWQRQTFSTKGWSDPLTSKRMKSFFAPFAWFELVPIPFPTCPGKAGIRTVYQPECWLRRAGAAAARAELATASFSIRLGFSLHPDFRERRRPVMG